jgi:membrane protein implicated in regulation of membrane protease activity
VLIVAGIILLIVLPDPWNLVAFAAGIILGSFELFAWSRSVRGLSVRAGAETLIGKRGRVVTPCRPVGQVAVAGELWQARCEAGADADETVTVVGREELLLVVEPER